MSDFFISSLEFDSSTLTKTPLSLNHCCKLKWKTPSGQVDALHVEVWKDEVIVLRREVEAHADESATLSFKLDKEGDLQMDCPNQKVTFLPADKEFSPILPFQVNNNVEMLDIVIIIDGTIGVPETKEGISKRIFFWDKEDKKDAFIQELQSILSGLFEQHASKRTAWVTFADIQHKDVHALDLKPKYHLLPESLAFDAVATTDEFDAFMHDIKNISGSSGGDYVDALADALRATCTLPWRDAARKIVLLFGDSPGYSITHPLPDDLSLADFHVREHDVEDQVICLHEKGVEIITVFHDMEFPDSWQKNLSELADYSKEQYERIASSKEHAFCLSSFSSDAILALLQGKEDGEAKVLARGSTYGYLQEKEH